MVEFVYPTGLLTVKAQNASKGQTFNDWLGMFERVYYLSQNIERDSFRILSHLVEVTGGLAKAIFKRGDLELSKEFLAKVIAWYCALSTSLGFGDLEAVVWEKYPRLCPYCREDACVCAGLETPSLDAQAVMDSALRRWGDRPRDLYQWQLMFDAIYDHSGSRVAGSKSEAEAATDLHVAFARLIEELGEVSEAIRLQYFYPSNVRNEIADLFAWVCGISTLLPLALSGDHEQYLADYLWETYPGHCPYCRNDICTCTLKPVREAISEAGIRGAMGRDSLTNLWNRERFDVDFSRRWVSPDSAGAVALAMFDIDDFKEINDTLGHEAGDKILRQSADLGAETLAADGELYRYGGDEFVALIGCSSIEEGRSLANSVRASLEHIEIGQGWTLRVSFGVVHISEGVEEPLTEADSRMYRDKRERKSVT